MESYGVVFVLFCFIKGIVYPMILVQRLVLLVMVLLVVRKMERIFDDLIHCVIVIFVVLF